jgi:ElaB/YqjD/DUF883 family membrane-anchored ribosome-binding protein
MLRPSEHNLIASEHSSRKLKRKNMPIRSVSKVARKEREAQEVEGSIKELRRDLDREIDAIRTTISEKGPAAAQESLLALKGEVNRRLAEVRDGFEESIETGRRMVQQRPLMAVGAALAVGILLGVILGRKTNGKSKD